MGIAPAHEQGVAVEIEARGLARVHRLGEAVGIVEAGAPEAGGEGLERPAVQIVVEAGEKEDIRPRLENGNPVSSTLRRRIEFKLNG